jgi:hypothetical protein
MGVCTIRDYRCSQCNSTKFEVYYTSDGWNGEDPDCCGSIMEFYPYGLVKYNAQLHEKERPIIWENPRVKDPKDRFFYPGVKKEMPERLKKDGFQVKEFTNFQEHVKFQKEHNLINKKTNE